jgi:carbonic anhydrase/acetyltransferase-like protein (isoleucine patch superfamily)
MPHIVPFGGSAPSIDSTAWVASNATLVGAVSLGPHASIFYGAVVRADSGAIFIGPGSNIQDNVTMHTDPGLTLSVGARVSVGHNAVLHGCTIEDDCIIGMNSTVLNGAIVGAGSLIAAGSVVLENTVIPSGSLVTGIPAKVVRKLSGEEQDSLVENARQYAELSQGHRTADR